MAKLDNYFLEKYPRFEKVVAPFLKTVSFLSFIYGLLFIHKVGFDETNLVLRATDELDNRVVFIPNDGNSNFICSEP